MSAPPNAWRLDRLSAEARDAAEVAARDAALPLAAWLKGVVERTAAAERAAPSSEAPDAPVALPLLHPAAAPRPATVLLHPAIVPPAPAEPPPEAGGTAFAGPARFACFEPRIVSDPMPETIIDRATLAALAAAAPPPGAEAFADPGRFACAEAWIAEDPMPETIID